MGLFDKLFRKKTSHSKINSNKNSGELISEIADGTNLVDGKQTWEAAEEKKNDLEFMKKCCEAELNTLEKVDIAPAPFYFERVAILSRKKKDYQQEVNYCEKYIKVLDDYYRKHGTKGIADIRKGPRYKAIKKRLPKAKELLNKQRSNA